MFFKKPNPPPRGVPLKDLEDALAPTTLKASWKSDTLIVKHEKLTTHVEVIAPANPESENGPISAVVTIKTPLPQEFSSFLSKPALISHINTMASLGAVTEKDGQLFIGSRLTVYEGDDAWRIQFPLVLFTIIGGVDSILGATRRMFGGEPSKGGESNWVEDDFEFIQSQLSRICVCTTGGKGLTAEFGLKSGAVSAGLGDHETALWQIMGDQPHPEFGGASSACCSCRIKSRARKSCTASLMSSTAWKCCPTTCHRISGHGVRANLAITQPTLPFFQTLFIRRLA